MKTTTVLPKLLLLFLLIFAFTVEAVPPPRGVDPVEAKKRERKNKIQREKDRRDDMWCYIKKRKKLSDGGYQCIYSCPTKWKKGKRGEPIVESNNVGPGFTCPSSMNVLRRGR